MAIVLSRDQVRRIDDLATNGYGVAGIVLMENAGRGAAEVIDRAYGPHGSAFIACGTGNNGGDGFVIARHLHNTGWSVRVMIAGDASKLSPDAATNDRIIQAMSIERIVAADGAAQQDLAKSIHPHEVVIDALLGTGFQGRVRSPLAEFIAALNVAAKRAMVAVDVPSGLDCDTGEPGGVAIHADLTITFVALKKGFLAEHARPYVGRCEVVDIGAPQELIRRVASEAQQCS
jgi:NAD(P)H-hydrate epimerase